MKYSQINLRSGLMERTQRKLDESQIDKGIDICPKIKVRQRERTKQDKGWMFR